MKIDVFNVANWFLSKEAMTHKKLQKLCYYAYSWFIYLYNDEIDNIENKLFEGKFEAWVHGPIIRELYKEYSKYKWGEIPKREKINLDCNDFLENIWDVYGSYTGDELETISHNESPWKNARKGLAPFESSVNVISESDMFVEYSLR